MLHEPNGRVDICADFSTALLCATASAQRPPNVLLLIGDDHGYPYFGFMGDENVVTPSMDALAAGWGNLHRSDFLGEVAGFGSSRTLRFIAEENLVDAQVSCSFAGGGRWLSSSHERI